MKKELNRRNFLSKGLVVASAAGLGLTGCNKAKEAAKGAADITKDAANKTANAVKDGAGAVVDGTKDAANAVKDGAGAVVEGTKDAAGAVVEGTKDAAGAVADGVKDTANAVKDGATNVASDMKEAVSGNFRYVDTAKNQQAKSLGYYASKNNVPTELRIDKQGTAYAKQNCLNCQLYKNVKGSQGGKCTIIPGEALVKSGGWCKSWTPKA